MTGAGHLEGVYGALARLAGHNVWIGLATMCLTGLWGAYRLLSNMVGS